MRVNINKIWEFMVDALYPPRCPICNDITDDKANSVCTSCVGVIPYVGKIHCMMCGKPMCDAAAQYCNDCLTKPHYYDEGRAALVYDEYMSRSIYRFKYNSKVEYARFFGRVIYDCLGRKIKSWNADALIPVPIHKSKMKSRGYNQAFLIAEELSKHVKIPVLNDYLFRKNQTKVQKNLTASERENNLKKAFIVRKNSVKLKSVIIVDDIYTTGSTIDAIAKILKESGAEKVYFVTLCIGRGI